MCSLYGTPVDAARLILHLCIHNIRNSTTLLVSIHKPLCIYILFRFVDMHNAHKPTLSCTYVHRHPPLHMYIPTHTPTCLHTHLPTYRPNVPCFASALQKQLLFFATHVFAQEQHLDKTPTQPSPWSAGYRGGCRHTEHRNCDL